MDFTERFRRPSIEIDAIGSIVAQRQTVSGRVVPRRSRVHLFVFSSDLKWYLQQEATIVYGAWSAECVFGDPFPSSQPNANGVFPYRLAAVVLKDMPPPDEPVDQLPDSLVSAIVDVHRKL